MLWKRAVHLHQTDMGYVCGNVLGVVKNCHFTTDFLNLNFKAMDSFLSGKRGEELEAEFKDKILLNHQPLTFKK